MASMLPVSECATRTGCNTEDGVQQCIREGRAVEVVTPIVQHTLGEFRADARLSLDTINFTIPPFSSSTVGRLGLDILRVTSPPMYFQWP